MTYTGQILANPPIKEAIFNISFQQAVTQEALTAFVENEVIKSKFSNIRLNYSLSVNVEQANKAPEISTTKAVPQGYILSSADGVLVAQVLTTQVSYHCLRQYVGWDVMFDGIKAFWDVFCSTVGKTNVTQVGVRYINGFELELQSQPISAFLALLPNVPKALAEAVGDFLIQMNFPKPNSKVLGIATETMSVNAAKFLPNGAVDIVLDINVINQGPFDCNQEPMWDAFNEIREHKNKLFFSILTPVALKKFE